MSQISPTFEIVGTIQEGQGKLDALLYGPDGHTYRVGENDRFGTDDARVISVKEDEIAYEIKMQNGTKSVIKKHLYTACQSPEGADKELTRGIVRHCMDVMSGALYGIYKEELSRNPYAKGIVELDIEISGGGRAKVSVNPNETTAPVSFARKIAERVDDFEFPDSESGFSGPYTINFFPR